MEVEEEPGVCSCSSDRPFALQASDSVSELKQKTHEIFTSSRRRTANQR